jgi:NDP-hexose C3-ketoreductase / dTDP-4-oxo-2-deoxy-alpha-D-pentos-2-ene 2,3-reductase
LCADLGHDPAEVGLAWLLAQAGVTAPIVGPRTGEQLASALRALELKLDVDALTKLDELFPPPGPDGAKPALEIAVAECALPRDRYQR